MFDFQQKRKIRVIFESRIIWGVLFFLATLILFSAYGRYLIAKDMAGRRAEVEAEMIALEKRKAELDAEVKYLSNERGIEAEIRRQFDVAREGEQVVIIVEEDAVATSTDFPTSTETKRPWYRFW